MPSNRCNTCLWIFYIPFVLAEVPSNMFMTLSWVKPNIFLGVQCFLLGMLCSYSNRYDTALVKSFRLAIS